LKIWVTHGVPPLKIVLRLLLKHGLVRLLNIRGALHFNDFKWMCLLNENVDVVVAVVVSVFAAWAGRDRWANQEGCFFLELFFLSWEKRI